MARRGMKKGTKHRWRNGEPVDLAERKILRTTEQFTAFCERMGLGLRVGLRCAMLTLMRSRRPKKHRAASRLP